MRLKVSNVCQLLDKSKYPATKTENGITFTAGTDGSIIVNGTCTSTVWANISSFELNPEHTFILIGCPGTNVNDVALYTVDAVTDETKQWEEGRGSLVTGNWYKNKVNYLYIRILTGYVCNNLTFKPQLYDLTEMYGAGNEPTTVAQFRQDFPNEMYEYSPECWKKFRRLKYVTETKNLFDISNADIISKDYYFTPNQGESSNFYVMTVTPDTIYTVSYERFINSDDTSAPSALELSIQTGTHYKDGTQLFFKLGGGERGVWVKRSGQFTVPSGINQVTFSGLRDRFLYRNFMVQEGSTASPYQPYGYLPLNRGKYIANKEPVQLLDKTKYRVTITREGITFTNNGDGTWTVVGTAPDDPINHSYVSYTILNFNKEFTQKYFIPGHKIVVGGGKVNYDAFVQWILGWTGGYLASNSAANYTYAITEYPENFGANNIELRVNKGKTVNFTFKPQFFDLTEMYGAGNEPTTVEQFRADFPNELYDYNPYNAITFR